MRTRYIYDAVVFSQEAPLNLVKDFVSIRLDRELKAELTQAAELEHRSLSVSVGYYSNSRGDNTSRRVPCMDY